MGATSYVSTYLWLTSRLYSWEHELVRSCAKYSFSITLDEMNRIHCHTSKLRTIPSRFSFPEKHIILLPCETRIRYHQDSILTEYLENQFVSSWNFGSPDIFVDELRTRTAWKFIVPWWYRRRLILSLFIILSTYLWGLLHYFLPRSSQKQSLRPCLAAPREPVIMRFDGSQRGLQLFYFSII